jgi:hypothetical protein
MRTYVPGVDGHPPAAFNTGAYYSELDVSKALQQYTA